LITTAKILLKTTKPFMMHSLKILCLFLLVFSRLEARSQSNNRNENTRLNEGNEEKSLIPYNLKRVARITGKSLEGETLPNSNKSDERYDVAGTDLGIMWDMGKGQVGILFGDTYGGDWKATGGDPDGPHWRSNVLAFSKDTDLEDGLTFSGMALSSDGSGGAREIIPSDHIRDGTGSHTTIPTAAIKINGVDYIHYMDVRKWLKPGEWATNFSGLYSSNDNGKTWQKCKGILFSDSSNFAQAAYARKDGYVYMLGTRSGRFGSAYLARFLEKDVLNLNEYQYWNSGIGWVKGDEKHAKPVFNGPAGELSLVFNTKYKRWIVTYLNEKKRQIILRDAKEISGPWSAEKVLVNLKDYPAAYGAFIHPNKNSDDELFFLMSMWQPYNVFLMKSELKFNK
jgi:hypothetical protein